MDNQETAKQEALTLHLDGVPSDGGDVRLAVFADKMRELRAALNETDRFLSGSDKATVELLVADLSHSSPSAVTIRSQGIEGVGTPYEHQLFEYFSDLVAQISSSAFRAATVSHVVLEKVGDLISGFGEKFSGMWLSRSGVTTAVISRETVDHIKDLLARQYTARGSVKGRVEKYNSHSDQKSFTIYPAIGGRVRCVFGEQMRKDASDAVEKSVIVHGLLKYQEGNFFPFEASVESIEILPSDSDLPRLSEMRGTAPNATGELNSADFVKNIRNEWN
jgi:hypothetical protein